MKAVQLGDYHALQSLAFTEVEKPAAGPGQVLVKVRYGGLRWADIMTVQEMHGRLFEPPFTIGQECVGEVEAVGAGVTAFKPGMTVMSLYGHKAFAEYAVFTDDELEVVPDGLPLEKVLIYALNLRVAYLACWPWTKVKAGETVLVHAAAGGVGRCILQILKRRFDGVTVIATASSDAKLAGCKAEGADHLINYVAQDYPTEVARITGGRGVDLIMNGVGGPTYAGDPQCLAMGGRWLIYGGVGGHTINIAGMAYKLTDILCRSVMPYRERPEYAEATQFMWDWLRSERLDEPTLRPLEKAPEAFHDLFNRKTLGKVIITV